MNKLKSTSPNPNIGRKPLYSHNWGNGHLFPFLYFLNRLEMYKKILIPRLFDLFQNHRWKSNDFRITSILSWQFGKKRTSILMRQNLPLQIQADFNSISLFLYVLHYFFLFFFCQCLPVQSDSELPRTYVLLFPNRRKERLLWHV